MKSLTSDASLHKSKRAKVSTAAERAKKCRPVLGFGYLEWAEKVVGWDTEGIVGERKERGERRRTKVLSRQRR